MKSILNDEEQERIRAAVAAAEKQTSGEIVPYIVLRSGRYEVALWRGAVAGAGIVMILALVGLQIYAGWGLGWAYTAWGMALLITLGGALGAVLPAWIPAVRRALAGERRMTERVHRRSEAAFLEEEVFNTRARTGILIFVSLFEHRIEVIGDAGINAAVEPEAWVEVVVLIRNGIRQGNLADGLVAGIARVGELLEGGGLEVHDDAPEELPDEVRMRKE